MKRKITALLLAVCAAALCLPITAGCSSDTGYTLKTDENGEKYYSVRCSGVSAYLSGEVEISAYYGEGSERYPVREIEERGFSSTSMKKITIPATVTKVGAAAFAYNNSLESVVFVEGSQLTEISQGMFGCCPALKEISLPQSVKVIGAKSFFECTRLESVKMPAVENILASAFENCTVLESVSLPETLTSIGVRAFMFTALKEVVIPDGVKNIVSGEDVIPAIGYAAFHSCTNLERAVVGSGVTEINEGVFGYCTALKEVTLPATLEKIAGARYAEDGAFYCGHAFHNDAALTDINFGGTAEQWEALKSKIDNKSVTYGGANYDNEALFRANVHFHE